MKKQKKFFRFSLPGKIFMGVSLIIISFTIILGYSIFQHQRTITTLNLLNQGYMKLTSTISELRTTQSIFTTMLGQVNSDTTTPFPKNFIIASRRYRITSVQESIKTVSRIRRLTSDKEEEVFLRSIEAQLNTINKRYTNLESEHQILISAIDSNNEDIKQKVINILRVERQINSSLREIFIETEQRMNLLSGRAQTRQVHFLWSLMILTAFSLLISTITILWIYSSFNPLKKLTAGVDEIAKGNLKHRVGINSSDEIGLLAREFNNMSDALVEREDKLLRSERLATIGKMSAQITHEIRNPLSALGLNTELLEEDLENLEIDKAKKKGMQGILKEIRKEIERLTDITQEYLEYARIPSPQKEEENINNIIESLCILIKPELEKRKVELVTKLSPELPIIKVDSSQIKQALLNLTKNAWEIMNDGGELTLITEKIENYVIITVKDCGNGIPKHIQEKIFNPFYTTKQRGAGLGLPLAHQIIVEHGGKMELISSEGFGTTFNIYLPI